MLIFFLIVVLVTTIFLSFEVAMLACRVQRLERRGIPPALPKFSPIHIDCGGIWGPWEEKRWGSPESLARMEKAGSTNALRRICESCGDQEIKRQELELP